MIESKRIQNELDNLNGNFKEDGIVKTVLRERVKQEIKKEKRYCRKCKGEYKWESLYCQSKGFCSNKCYETRID